MKTITRTIAVLNILIALTALGCDQPAFEKPAAPETGVVQVILGGGGGGGWNILRTMLPAYAYDVTSLYYTLTFSATGGPAEGLGPVSGAIAKGESSGEFSLAAGTWSLEVKGFASESASADAANALVSGSASGIVISGSAGTPVNVALTPDESKLTQIATGTLSYNVSFPGGVTGASLAVYNDSRELVSLGGGNSINPVNLTASGTGSVTLASGVYYLALTVYMAGKVVARWETAHIYDGLVTPAVYSLTEADFAATGSITAFSLRNGTNIYNGRIDQTSKTIRVIVPRSTYTAGLAVNGIGWTGVLIAPTPATPNFASPVSYTITLEDGQTVTYTVQVSDEVSSAADLTAFLSDMPQNTAASPIQVKMSNEVNLSDANGNGFSNFLSVIKTSGRYIDLDLSACAMSGTEFDPSRDYIGADVSGRPYITGLVLPDAAISIRNGIDAYPAFFGFSVLKTLSASNVETVGGYAFDDHNDIETVFMPKAKTIGQAAFSECGGLVSVDLPEVVSIGNSAFYGCTSLESVSLSATLANITGDMFAGCVNLTNINVDTDNPYYTGRNGMLLNKTETTLIAYPSAAGSVTLNSVTIISQSAFQGSTGLTAVYLPAAVTIGNYAFASCSSFATVNLPEATSIGDCAFSDCDSLVTVWLPKAKTIGNRAFESCPGLKTVSLPKAETIGYNAFWACPRLEEVSLPEAKSIGDGVFSYPGTVHLTVTLGSTAPSVGTKLFLMLTPCDAKSVTVRVPSGATGYGTVPSTYTTYTPGTSDNWGNGFRGGGWNSTDGYGSGGPNTYITLSIQYY